jgi:hypothetical protein
MCNVIIIDKMSMMISYMLRAIEEQMKQATPLTNAPPFENKLALLVGDLS